LNPFLQLDLPTLVGVKHTSPRRCNPWPYQGRFSNFLVPKFQTRRAVQNRILYHAENGIPMHRLKSFTIAVWLTGLISIALVWAQARWYAFPPPYLPLCLLLIALAVGTLI